MTPFFATIFFGGVCSFVTSLGLVSVAAHAQNPAEQALKAITDAADRICGTVNLSGQSSSFKITGDVKAEVSGLVKKLVDLGIIGTGEATSTNYEVSFNNNLPIL